MEDSTYTVLMGLGNQFQKIIYSYEKDYKLSVWRWSPEHFPKAFYYAFCHFADDGRTEIKKQDLPAWLNEKGIDEAECKAAAEWYIREHLHVRDLHYHYFNLGVEVNVDFLFGYDKDGNRYEL